MDPPQQGCGIRRGDGKYVSHRLISFAFAPAFQLMTFAVSYCLWMEAEHNFDELMSLLGCAEADLSLSNLNHTCI